MRMMGRYVLFLWVAMAPQLASGTFYFVATNGNDAHNGLYSSYMGETNGPFRTLNRAASKLQAGDSLEIRGGTYAEKVNFSNSGTAAGRITIKNYGHESVIIDGQYNLPGGSIYYFLVVVSGDYVTLSNITIMRSSGGLLALTGDYAQATNVVGNGSRENGMVATGNYDLFDGCTMTDNGNGYNPPVQNTWGSAISLDVGSHSTIQNCLSYNNRGEGLCVGRNTTHAVIQDCIAYDNAALGIYIVSASDCLIRRNIVYCSADSKYGSSSGIVIGDEYATGLSNLQIVNNLCIGNFLNFVSDSNVKKASGWTIAHNTFLNTQKTQALIDVGYNMNVYFRPDLVEFSNSIFKNNMIVEEAGNQVPINATLTNPHSGFTFSNNCWNKTPTAAALGTGDVIGDPLIAKSGSTGAGLLTPAYFKISANSPARDKAAVLSEVTEDFFKTARGSSPDIGAHEFVGGSSSVVELILAAKTGAPAPGSGGVTDPSPGGYAHLGQHGCHSVDSQRGLQIFKVDWRHHGRRRIHSGYYAGHGCQ